MSSIKPMRDGFNHARETFSNMQMIPEQNNNLKFYLPSLTEPDEYKVDSDYLDSLR